MRFNVVNKLLFGVGNVLTDVEATAHLYGHKEDFFKFGVVGHSKIDSKVLMNVVQGLMDVVPVLMNVVQGLLVGVLSGVIPPYSEIASLLGTLSFFMLAMLPFWTALYYWSHLNRIDHTVWSRGQDTCPWLIKMSNS